jgi:hypothetical protein
VRFDDLSTDVESESQTAVMAVGHCALESAKDAFLLIGRNANTMVLDTQIGVDTIRPDTKFNGFAGTILDGVGELIRANLRNTCTIPHAARAPLGVNLHGRARTSSLLAQFIDTFVGDRR